MGFGRARENDVQLQKDKSFDGLTPKQYNYATARAAGATMSEAYRTAYDVGPDTDPVVANWDARTVEAHPLVVKRVRELVARNEAVNSLAPLVTKEWIINGVANIASNEQLKPADRLKAYDMLGRSVGIDLFRDVTVIEKRERTPAEIQAELKAKLESLMPTIEGHATSKPPGAKG